MDRERGSKVIAIVALCVGVVGLSLGFASFSSSLTIKSNATVDVADNFSVYFDESSINTTPTGGATGGTPTVTNTALEQGSEIIKTSSIGNLTANFTAPGQSVTYTFNAVNNGQYIAYLNTVTFANAADAESFKVCKAGTGTTEVNVNGEKGACNGITLTLKVDGQEITPATTSYTNAIAIGETAEVEVTIAYNNVVEGQLLADGDFTVAFGDIQLVYESINK